MNPPAASAQDSGAATPAGLGSVGWLAGLVLLMWLQVFWLLVDTWRFGEYYTYGWFVPPLAIGLAWRRWQMLRPPSGWMEAVNPRIPRWFAVGSLLALLCLLPLRIILVADPMWRPPLLLNVAVMVALTHGLLWVALGRRFSIGMAPVTLFALSAVPYPWRIEQEVIGTLTGWVVSFTHEMFLLAGRPVEAFGGILVLGGERVEVSEGCSGIRSFQSLVMVALFFGELLWLSFGARVVLLLAAAGCAVVVNAARAYWLAVIHFGQGKEAADAAHDGVGHVAFVTSAVLLYLASLFFLRLGRQRKQVIRRIQVQGSKA